MRKVINSKYDGAAKEIIDIVELFQPINTVDVIKLAGLESNYAFAIGVIHTLSEVGIITRDDSTGLYWYTPYNSQFVVNR